MAKVKGANTLASTPSSSMLSPTRNQSPADYLKMLSEMRAGLSKIAIEVPNSRPPSPSRQSEKRVETLREKVKEAYGLAGGDPAQGKWGHMANLLKMTSTVEGYRPWGLGVKRSHEVRWERTWEWSSLKTEQDWFDWERGQNKLKDAEDASLKAKVETWKSNIAVVPDPNLVGVSVPDSSQVVVDSDGTTRGYSVGQQGKGNGKGSDVKGPLPLAFPVVKRSGLAANGKKGKEKATSSQNNDEDPNSQEGIRRPKGPRNGKGKSTSHVRTRTVSRPVDALPAQPDSVVVVDINMASPASTSPKRIGDISEEYLPPSFPSDLGQSTPGPGKANVPPPAVREKPPPITARRHSQLSLSSPPPSLNLNASPQSSPTPIRSNNIFYRDQGIPLSQPLPTSTRKRARPLTPPSDDLFSGGKVASHALKKARTMPTVPHPRGLLVSHGSSPSAKAPTSPGSASELEHVTATPKRQVPMLADLIRASARKPKPSLTSSMRKINSMAKDHGKGKEKVQGPPSKRLSPCSDTSLRPVPQPYLSGLPAFSQNPGAFTPDFMSTQPPLVPSTGFLDMGIESAGGNGGTGAGSGDFFGVGYDSQFDLEKHADSVSELLERDVDFAGWLKQIPEDSPESP